MRAARPTEICVVAIRELENVHIAISEKGSGLPDDRRSEPFTAGQRDKLDGMGLGLAIVHDCIEAMGGTVGVRSTGAVGTCFEVILANAERLDGAAMPCEFTFPPIVGDAPESQS